MAADNPCPQLQPSLLVEEYGTSDDSMSDDLLIQICRCDFNYWEFFQHHYLNLKMMGVVFGMLFVMIWPIIGWILLKLVGYAVIGLTLGRGYEFVNSTFFQWADKMEMDIDFSIWLFTEGREESKFVGCMICIYFMMFF